MSPLETAAARETALIQGGRAVHRSARTQDAHAHAPHVQTFAPAHGAVGLKANTSRRDLSGNSWGLNCSGSHGHHRGGGAGAAGWSGRHGHHRGGMAVKVGSGTSVRRSQCGGGSTTVYHHQTTVAAATAAHTAPAAATTERRGGSRGGGELEQAKTETMTDCKCKCVRSEGGGSAAAAAAPFCAKGTLPPLLGLTISRWLDRRLPCFQRNRRPPNGGGVSVQGGWHKFMRRRH